MLSIRNELNVLKRSLILLFGVAIAVWVPLKVAVCLQNLEAAKFKISGGRINTSKLEKYENANERILYLATGIALVISQSAVWMVAMSRKKDETAEQEAPPAGESADAPSPPVS
jgi:hypothetical protein